MPDLIRYCDKLNRITYTDSPHPRYTLYYRDLSDEEITDVFEWLFFIFGNVRVVGDDLTVFSVVSWRF